MSSRRELENAKIISRINGFPESFAQVLLEMSQISSKSMDTVMRNAVILWDSKIKLPDWQKITESNSEIPVS